MAVYSKKRKDGSTAWYYRFQYEGKEYRAVGGTTKTQALRGQEKVRADLINGRFEVRQNVKNPTLESFSEKFLERRRELRSYKRYVIFVRHLKEYFGKNTTLSSIQTENVEDYKGWRQAQGVSNATVNREIACLKRMFNQAVQWGDARRNPVVGIKFLDEAKFLDRCLTQEEGQRLIDSCADYFRPIVIIALNTGMRLQEILTLTWKQVKLAQGYIELVNTKSNEKRYVTLNDTAIDCLSKLEEEKHLSFVFSGQRHQPLKSVRKPWIHAREKGKIDSEFRFHDLRHSYISHSIMAGVDLFTIAQQVGHKDLRLIQERYGHLLAEHRRRAVRAIDGIFAPKESRHLYRTSAQILNIAEGGK
jgi:site-specific recombinase XerD